MKHLFLVPLLIVSILSLSFGKPWHPYVAVGGLVNQPMPFARSMTEGWIPVLPSLGTHFEFGNRGRNIEIYIVYCASNSPVRTAVNSTGMFIEYEPNRFVEVFTYEQLKTSWSERRFYLGIRRHFAASPARVVPFVGGAVSLGWSKLREYHFERDRFYLYGDQPDSASSDEYAYSDVRESKLNPGLAVEFGMLEKIASNVDALVMTNIQLYGASLPYSGTDLISYEHHYVICPTLMLQLRYVFN